MSPPADATPDPLDMAHAPEQAEFLQPRQGEQAVGVPISPVQKAAERASADTVDAAEIESRPSLPDARTLQGIDWAENKDGDEDEDEDADPVTEAGAR